MPEGHLKARLHEAILETVRDSWRANNRALLLSQLGLYLRKLHPELVELIGNQKLSAYIEDNLSDQIQLVQHPELKPVVGAAPRNAAVNLETAFASVEPASPAKHGLQYRFAPVVWAAFSVPLQPNLRRYLNIATRGSFVDLPTDSPQPDHSCEIPAEYVFPRPENATYQELSSRADVIDANIRKWAQQNNIDVEKLAPQAVPPRQDLARQTRSSAQSLLDVVLDTLDDSELRRITMPLDVVRKLRSHSLK